MFLSQLSLENFRNYQRLDLEIQPGNTVFLGKNGQGKTNLVESIRYLATLSSHRVSGYQALIKQDQPTAKISAVVNHAERSLTIDLELNREEQNRGFLNKSPLPKIRDLLGLISSVTFAPEDIDIVRRDPSHRRDFIDELVVQFTPRLAHSYQEFERVLKQRNSLLKSIKSAGAGALSKGSTLEIWDEALVRFGSEIIYARAKLVNLLAPEAARAYLSLSNSKKTVSIGMASTAILGSQDTGTQLFDPSTEESNVSRETAEILSMDLESIASSLAEAVNRVRQKEIERGITLIGPQRDELVLGLGGLPAKGFASHGETWSLALALRLATFKILQQESAVGDPILILDDVFAELDDDRRALLSQLVETTEQTLITAAVEDDIPLLLRKNIVEISGGRVVDQTHSSTQRPAKEV